MKRILLILLTLYISLTSLSEMVAQPSNWLLEITLLPNFTTRSVVVTGRFQDASCADLGSLSWIKQAKLLTTSDRERVCSFILSDFGDVVIEDDTYWLNIRDFELIGEDSGLDFFVAGADVITYYLSTQDDPLPLTRSDWLWHVENPSGELQIQIHPWAVETTLTITPLLPGPFKNSLNVSLLVSGNTAISGIQDADAYYAFVGRGHFDGLSDDDLLMSYLDYPPALTADIFPGLDDVYTYDRLHKTNLSTLFLQGVVNSHARQDAGEGGRVVLSFVGVDHLFSQDTLIAKDCPGNDVEQAYQPQLDEHKLSLCVRLGPNDTLTIQLRNALISHTSIPSNQHPAPDTVIYNGGGWLRIDIYYLPFTALYLQHLPFTLRVIMNPLENRLLSMIQPTSLLSTLWAFAIFGGIFLFIQFRNPSSLLKLVLCYLAGIVLLYWTQSTANLLCLSLLISPIRLRRLPHFFQNHTREALLIASWVILLTIENFFAIHDQGIFSIEPTSTDIHHTPLAIFCGLICIALYIYLPWKDVAKRDKTLLVYAHKAWLPTYAFFLLIVITYDVLDRSLISLTLIVVTSGLIAWLINADKSPEATDSEPLKNVLHLRRIAKQPLIMVLISIVILLVIGSGTNSLNGIFFTIVTITSCIWLFTMLYNYIPGERGYIRALIFPIPLMLIFFMGIGTAAIPLRVQGSLTVSGPATSYALFMDQLPALFIGRIIFYVSIPMLMGLYLDLPEQVDGNKQGFFKDPQSFFSFGSALLSILVPSLYNLLSSTPALTTFVDLVQHIVTLTGGGT